MLTLTPRLDTALVLRTATVEGKRQALQATQGINAGCLLWRAAVAFALVSSHVVLGLAWSLVLIGATRPLSGFLRKEKAIRWMGRTTGLNVVMFAVRLAFSKR